MTKKILVIDDDPEVLEGLKFFLEPEYEVQISESSRDLNQLLKGVDLAILDVMMPEKIGREVAEDIRAVSTVPILFYTAYAGQVPMSDLLDKYHLEMVHKGDERELKGHIDHLLQTTEDWKAHSNF